MLSIGSNIRETADQLQKIQVDYLYNRLRHPRTDIEARIRQLRAIREIDSRQYALLKRALPYLVCASFNPPYRKTENFAYTEFFILDIDHISSAEKDYSSLRREIQKDTRVMLSFASPSGDGLKLLFKLKERCWDSGIYSLFYKAFARSFGLLHHISDILDTRTSDVCRACFISYDPDSYYNPSASPVDINEFIDTSDVSAMFSMKRELESIPSPLAKSEDAADFQGGDPDAETMKRIRQILSGKPPKEECKAEVYVPEELNAIMDGLILFLQENGLAVNSFSNIQYGKNIRIQLGLKKAEINLFYGKRGFTVVECPRTGTNKELNHLCSELIKSHLNQLT